MDIALPSFILGYHGCDREVAEQVFAGDCGLHASNNDYDWLADGIYFWEHNAQRAYDFARAMAERPHPSKQTITTPAVVGAIINLGFLSQSAGLSLHRHSVRNLRDTECELCGNS